MGFWVFFGVRDTAATRGQYLASSKALLSSFDSVFSSLYIINHLIWFDFFCICSVACWLERRVFVSMWNSSTSTFVPPTAISTLCALSISGMTVILIVIVIIIEKRLKWTELCTVHTTQLNWHFSSVHSSSVVSLCTLLRRSWTKRFSSFCWLDTCLNKAGDVAYVC